MGHSRQRALRGVLLSGVEQEDAQLVRASQQGDQDAFALLVRRYQRRIFNLSVRMLEDEGDANESTQEAFVTAWLGLPGFRGEASFPTWLYRIAYNCCLRQLEQGEKEDALHAAIEAEHVLVESSSEQQAAEASQRHDLQALVHEQLELLPLTYRTILILRHLHDQTYEEIAAILSMPIGTVKDQLFRARALLKERLAGTALLVKRETVSGTPLTANEEVKPHWLTQEDSASIQRDESGEHLSG